MQDMDDIIQTKPRLLIMTKADLCDKEETKKWISYYFCSSLSYIPPQYDDLFLFTLKLLIEEKEKNNGEIIYYNSSYNINVQDPIKELIFNGGGTIC